MSKHLTLIIPAKQEPNALPLVLDELKENKLSCKIIIIMDKDDIQTFKAVRKYDCKILFQTKKGYGNAIIEGLNQSNTKYCCIFYADGSTDPKYLNLMLKKLKDENLNLLFGSRYEKNAGSFDDDYLTRFGNHIFTFLGNFFMKLGISDLLFTYIMAQTRDLKNLNLKSDNYCLCVEIPFEAKRKKYSYSTFPCIERKRFADLKKVKAFKDGLVILVYMIKKYLNTINIK